VGASAQHLYVVILGLLLAGLGSGGQVQAVAILSESVHNKDRGWVQGESVFLDLLSSSFKCS
jgi:hypothetical protein